MGLRSLEIFLLFQHGNRLYTSESALHVRIKQILTYKVGPRSERKIFLFLNITYVMGLWTYKDGPGTENAKLLKYASKLETAAGLIGSTSSPCCNGNSGLVSLIIHFILEDKTNKAVKWPANKVCPVNERAVGR